MKKIFFYAVILTVCFTSCNKEEFIENNELAPEEVPTLAKVYLADVDANTLRPFAIALYDALKESPRLREIIKTEVLKQFNKEYDVLYQFVKNELIEDGLTVRQLLLKHFENEAILATIEASHPTLTIFVPQLPENSFSAEIWNTIEQVPAVAIHSTKQSHIPIIADYGFFDKNSNEFIMEAGHIPAFPVVVIKDNTRVIVAKNRETLSAALSNKKNSSFTFEFTDEFFDGSKIAPISTQSISPSNIDQKLVDAYSIYQNFDGWQRDYVYYGLAPTSSPAPRNAQTTSGRLITIISDEPDLPSEEEPIGTFSRDFKETVTSFRFSPSVAPEQMLWYLTNHSGDPTLIPGAFYDTNYPWTDGNYAFRLNVVAASTGAPVVSQIFIASPEELFEVTYKRSITMGIPIYIPEATGFKTKNLNIPLMAWNLDSYAPEMKISIAKENPDQTITSTTSVTTEFAANVSADLKIGLKFGVSGKVTKNATFQTVTRLTNKDLGDVLIHFGDKVILDHRLYTNLGKGKTFTELREYNSSLFVITVVPKRVQ